MASQTNNANPHVTYINHKTNKLTTDSTDIHSGLCQVQGCCCQKTVIEVQAVAVKDDQI